MWGICEYFICLESFFSEKKIQYCEASANTFQAKKMFFGEQDHALSNCRFWGSTTLFSLEKGFKKCNMSYEQDSISVKISHMPKEQDQTLNLSKILHRRIFRLKILHRQFHLSTVLRRKNTKNEWKWRNLHRWQKFYTAAGSDGMDKFHLCTKYL